MIGNKPTIKCDKCGRAVFIDEAIRVSLYTKQEYRGGGVTNRSHHRTLCADCEEVLRFCLESNENHYNYDH